MMKIGPARLVHRQMAIKVKGPEAYILRQGKCIAGLTTRLSTHYHELTFELLKLIDGGARAACEPASGSRPRSG